MKYNTQLKRMPLPEYGRNIQNIVDYAVTIEDPKERRRCADSIISIMGNLFPHLRDVNDFKHILWDHLAIMSDFKLDIEYPYEIIKKEKLNRRPPVLPYSFEHPRYRHYGKRLEDLIHQATLLEDSPKKEFLIWTIAIFMKKQYLTWNKDSVDDRKILKDLSTLSKGLIELNPETYKLPDSRELITQPVNLNKNIRNRKNNVRKNR